MRFLNRFVETAKDARERIMIQTELEEAGFELLALKKRLLLANNTNSGGSSPEDVRLEQLLQVTTVFPMKILPVQTNQPFGNGVSNRKY